MKYKIAVFLFVILPITSCELDFSQFHLPPCCHISHMGTDYSGYSSASNRASVNTKREVNSHNEIHVKDSSKVHQSYSNKTYNEKSSKYETKSKKRFKYNKHKIYRIIVPLDEIVVKSLYNSTTKHEKQTGQSSTTQRPETSLKPPTMGKILVPEIKNESQEISKFKRNSNNGLSRTQLLQEVINLELEGAESQRSFTNKKSLVDDDSRHLKPEHREEIVGSESKSIPSQYKLVSKEEGYVEVENVGTTSKSNSYNNTSSGNPVKRQTATRRVPSTWLTNLRRALYQSLTAADKTQADEGAGKFQDLQNLSQEKIKYPEIWRNIQAAPVQYVNKMAQVSSGTYQIFLPRGEGPVASGVLVNTRNHGLQVRVATELSSPENFNQQSGCSCYLLNHGEIPVAYWAVTRVLHQKRRAALQYLVYPLPHSVPTPPEMFPMNSNPMFDPSPIDPFSNFYENANRQQMESPMQQLRPTFQHGNQIDKDYENSPPSPDNPPSPPQPLPPPQHFDSPRNPKYIHELPNGHHRIEMYSEDFRPQPSPMPPGFTKNVPQQTNQEHPFLPPPPPPQPPQVEFQPGPQILPQINFQPGPPIPFQPNFQPGPFQQGPGPVPFVNNNENEQIFLPPEAQNPSIAPISDLELYRKIAENNFQNPINQISINQNNLISGGSPYDRINGLPQQPVSPTPFQDFLPPLPPNPTQFLNNQGQVQPINPTNPGPTQFTLTAGDNQINKPPTFPKSIQEIISPYALGPDVPKQGQFDTNSNPQGNRNHEGNQNDVQNNLNPIVGPNSNGQDDSKDNGVTGSDPYPPSSIHSTSQPYSNNEDKDNSGRNRPYIVSNVLDNERKYYPVRKPYKVAYSKDYYVRRPAYHRRPTLSRYQRIDDKRGYILNF